MLHEGSCAMSTILMHSLTQVRAALQRWKKLQVSRALNLWRFGNEADLMQLERALNMWRHLMLWRAWRKMFDGAADARVSRAEQEAEEKAKKEAAEKAAKEERKKENKKKRQDKLAQEMNEILEAPDDLVRKKKRSLWNDWDGDEDLDILPYRAVVQALRGDETKESLMEECVAYKPGVCARFLSGHDAPVLDICCAKDNKKFATTSADKKVKVWDLESGDCLGTGNGHEAPVLGVAYDDSSKYMVTCSEDGTVRIWDGSIASLKKTLVGHEGAVYSCDWRPGYQHVCSGGQDKKIKLWDVDEGTCIMTIIGHEAAVRSFAFTPDGETGVSCGDDLVMRTWWFLKINDLVEQTDIYTEAESSFAGHTGPITHVAANIDDATVATCSADNTIKLWFLDAYEAKIDACFNTLVGHKSRVNKVAFTGDGKRLASVGDGMVVHILWAAKGGKHMTNLAGHTAHLQAVSWSSNGRLCLSGSDDGKIGIWDVDAYDELAEGNQFRQTGMGTYNDDSAKNILQSFLFGESPPQDT